MGLMIKERNPAFHNRELPLRSCRGQGADMGMWFVVEKYAPEVS